MGYHYKPDWYLLYCRHQQPGPNDAHIIITISAQRLGGKRLSTYLISLAMRSAESLATCVSSVHTMLMSARNSSTWAHCASAVELCASFLASFETSVFRDSPTSSPSLLSQLGEEDTLLLLLFLDAIASTQYCQRAHRAKFIVRGRGQQTSRAPRTASRALYCTYALHVLHIVGTCTCACPMH